MRVGSRFVAGVAALALGGLAVLAMAQTPRPVLDFAPYANMHAMQQGSSLDLGFLPDEVHPGFGGEGVGVDIAFSNDDLHLTCPDGAYRIALSDGLLVRADLFCPTDQTDHADVEARLLASGFARVKDFTQDKRRPDAWGRTVADAFEALPEEQGGTVARIILSRWERPDGHSVSLSAAYYAPAGRTRPMLEMDISAPKTCLFPLSVFTKSSVGDDSWTSPLVEPVRPMFNDAPWESIPLEQRYELAAEAAMKLCSG